MMSPLTIVQIVAFVVSMDYVDYVLLARSQAKHVCIFILGHLQLFEQPRVITNWKNQVIRYAAWIEPRAKHCKLWACLAHCCW